MATQLICGAILMCMSAASGQAKQAPAGRNFAGDVEFLTKHTDIILLGEGTDAQVAVAPRWQGRVMTSTARGGDAPGFGWINDELIASGKVQPHINVFGGEDRFWMGPEGGQFAIYFKQGDPFDLTHWQTPACIDTEPYTVMAKDARKASFRHQASLTNYSGSKFNVQIDRTVRVLDKSEAEATLGVAPGAGVRMVAYQSENKITNVGDNAWTKATGLLSIWILGMYKPSPNAVVLVPFREGGEDQRGPIVNDAYFGKVPADRLRIAKGVIYLRGDGQHRSKIGLSPRRAKSVVGSYDSSGNVLTIVQYNQPAGATDYVNSMWELQKDPFGGDVVNSYNDGPPPSGGKPLGPFYELETSSPAAALKSGESLAHIHRTFHFVGPEAELDQLARSLLGVTLQQIKAMGGS